MSDVVGQRLYGGMGSRLKLRAATSGANKANTVIDKRADPKPQGRMSFECLRQFERSVSSRRRSVETVLSARPAGLWLLEDPRPRFSASRLNHRKKHARSVLGIVINVNMPAARLGRGDL